MQQILQRYEGTPFDVTLAGSITTSARTQGLTIRAGTMPSEAKPKATEPKNGPRTVQAFVEIIPPDETRIDGTPQLALSDPPPPGLSLLDGIESVVPPEQAAKSKHARRFAFQLSVADSVKPGEIITPLELRLATTTGGEKQTVEAKFDVIVRVDRPSAAAAEAVTGVALVSGSLELRLGHLCDQKGCVEHFHQSLADMRGLAGVRPRPSLKSPAATAYLRAGQAIDIWGLREKLRGHSVEIVGMQPREVEPYVMRVELPRWRKDESSQEVQQCLICREQATETAGSLPWVEGIDVAGGGVNIRLKRTDVDCVELLDALSRAGIAPVAVWLVPDGVPMPKAAQPRVARRGSTPKQGGSVAQALVQFQFGHTCEIGSDLLEPLTGAKWSNRTGLRENNDGTTLSATVAEREYAILTPQLDAFRAAGQTPRQIRLSEFGDVRIQLEFDHICGELEYSKPPKKSKSSSKKTDAKEKPCCCCEKTADSKKPSEKKPQPMKPKAQPEERKPQPKKAPKTKSKPFVPRPLRPHEFSNGRKAIEAAVARVGWIKDAVYQGYHTQATFRGPRKFFVAFQVKGADVVRLDELIAELRRAGFPPKTVTVSRLFPGIPFAKPLPPDLKVTDSDGKQRLLSSLRQPGRPLAVAFVSLNCPRKEKYTADARFYGQLKKTMASYQDRVTFVAISANSKDKFPEVAEFLNKAGWDAPLLHDASGNVAKVFNSQAPPPPHIFLFDKDGLLRYAGDAHDSWEKPDTIKKNFLEDALKLVLAGKYQANGAVFYNKSLCNCSDPNCKCPKCGCGPSCRCAIKH